MGRPKIGFSLQSVDALHFSLRRSVCCLFSRPGSAQERVWPSIPGEDAQSVFGTDLQDQFEHHTSGGAPVTFRFMEFNLLENVKWLIQV